MTDKSQYVVVVAEFALSDPKYPFVRVSQKKACQVQLEKMLPRGSGSYGEFFSINGTDPEGLTELGEGRDFVEPNLITRHENGGLFEFVVEGFFPARNLAERGQSRETASLRPGRPK